MFLLASRIGDTRIPKMPSLDDGEAICVLGMAATSGSEHNQAHLADGAIEGSSNSNTKPPYTAPLVDVVRVSTEAMMKVRPDCRKEIAAAVAKQFGKKNPDQLLRAKRLPPLPDDTLKALKSGAIRGWP